MAAPPEYERIAPVAHQHGIDPLFICAIRHAEQGRAGREFGVMLADATDYGSQLRGCVKTIRSCLLNYLHNPFVVHQATGFRRLIYSQRFIQHTAAVYCPIGVGNDPQGLNRYWLDNVSQAYLAYVEDVKGR